MPPDLARSLPRARRLVGLVASSTLVALACFILGVWAWTRPLRASSSSVAPYESVFTLGYRATPKPGTAYGSGPVVTGEPLFLAALDTLQLSVRYDFHAPQPASVAGTLTAQAVVADNGLVVPLGKAAMVGVHSGVPSTATLPISLVRYRNALASLGRLSGVGTYPVEVEATVRLHGRLHSRALTRTVATTFTFEGDAGTLAPLSEASGTTTRSIAPAAAAASSFHHVLRGDLRWPRTSPRQWHLGLLTARPRSFALALLSVGVLAAALAVLWCRRLAGLLRSDERIPTLLRAGTRIVEVEKPTTLRSDRQVTELRHITDLLRVARALETPLLVVETGNDFRLEARDGQDVYVLSLGGRRTASSGETIDGSTEGCFVADGEPRRSSERSWQSESPPAVNGRRA